MKTNHKMKGKVFFHFKMYMYPILMLKFRINTYELAPVANSIVIKLGPNLTMVEL